jgi:hypothetical protein
MLEAVLDVLDVVVAVEAFDRVEVLDRLGTAGERLEIAV